MPDVLFCVQAIADEAQGENVLIVTHGDGVNASVTRIWPWAIAHPVLHTGFTVAMREREDGRLCRLSTGLPLLLAAWSFSTISHLSTSDSPFVPGLLSETQLSKL